MRGKVSVAITVAPVARITPAYAGKSTGEKNERGEDTGSPPPMRGKAAVLCRCDPPPGITPAYAGKSVEKSRRGRNRRDHPRLCGEKLDCDMMELQRKGSPPPMRGKVVCILKRKIDCRITPAYAGKSNGIDHCDDQDQDHPRLCGEKRSKTRAVSYSQGSPPPMRGKVSQFDLELYQSRITPAYAGKSFLLSLSLLCGWDHPRLCGEKKFPGFCMLIQLGSPPPMRGKAIYSFILSNSRRITPAYAGKSLILLQNHTMYQDHPRLCGEKSSTAPA